MNLIKLLIFTLLCASSFEMAGATIPFRLGNFLSAEISRNKVTIKNFDSFNYNIKFKHYAYAVVTFRLDKGRTISIYDFKLALKGEQYKCIALRSGDKNFDTKNWHITKTSPKTVYSLLFIVDSEVLGNAKKTLPAELLYTLTKSGQTEYELPFNFINYTDLTQIDKIPSNGLFPEIETPNHKSSPENLKNEF